MPADLKETDDLAAVTDRRRAVATVIVAAVLAVIVSAIVVPRLRDAGQLAYPESSAIVQQGAEVYASSRASCHGADLNGGVNAQGFVPPPPDAAGHAWLHSDASLFRMVKFGITGCQTGTSRVRMPSFNQELDDRSIRAALAFIKNPWPASLRGAQNTFNDSESDTAETQEAVLCTAICQSPSPRATGR